MTRLTQSELRKALKLSLHMQPEESDRIFQQARSAENDQTVNFGKNWFSLENNFSGRRIFFSEPIYFFADNVLTQLLKRTEYAHLFTANESSKKTIWKCLLKPDIPSTEHQGKPFHNPVCSTSVWETYLQDALRILKHKIILSSTKVAAARMQQFRQLVPVFPITL